MSSYVTPVARSSQASTLAVSAAAPVASAALTQHHPAPAQTQAPEEADKAAVTPRGNSLAVSQILMNAEGMIASVMGLPAQEVTISVNLGRYEF